MLDWTKIDNDKTFQRLVNHLFSLECNSPGFIPSSPNIGADGGWDGYHLGEYALEHEKGKWSIQAKWTTKSHKDAMPYLKREIKRELQKAKKNQVDHLRIATNAELKVNQVQQLEVLKGSGVTTLKVWQREALSLRIERQPWLRYFFFGRPQHPMLVPPSLYFKEIEDHLLPVPVTNIGTFNEYVRQAEQFIRSKTKSILLVHSPGGYGKSHLLKHVADIFRGIDPDRQCWMARAGHRKAEDAIQDEIATDRDYVVILDDADRYLESVKPLVSLTRLKDSRFKLVLAMRSSGFTHILDAIAELRCEGLHEEIRISDWSKKDLVRLLRLAADQEKVENEDLIASKYCNPFLIVWIGERIKRVPTLGITDIRQKFVGEIRFEAERCLEGVIEGTRLDEFLTSVACIVPFSKNDENLLDALNEQTKAETPEQAVNPLVNAGILRVVGNSVRFNPDMLGDLYLAYRLEDIGDIRELEQLVEKWMPLSANKLFINLEAALRYAKSTHVETILSNILSSWVAEAETTPGDIRTERLSLIENMAQIIPQGCLDLMNAYLSSEARPSDNVYLKTLAGNQFQPNSDHYGPVLLKMQVIPEVRKELTDIAEQLQAKNLTGTYSNYKPASLIERFVSPLDNGWKLISTTLDILQQWVQQPTNVRIRLASAGLSEILRVSHERVKYGFGCVTFQEVCIRMSAEMSHVRDRALDILTSMLRHSLSEIKLAGVDVAQQIGRSRMGRVVDKDVPLAARMAQERKEIVRELSNLVSPKTDFPLLSAIEDAFLKWWAQQTEGTEEVLSPLSKLPRSPEYLVFRCFAATDFLVIDFDELKAQAPKTDRWSWFVDHVFKHNRFLAYEPDGFRDLAGPLNDKFNSENALIGYLKKLEEQIAPYDPPPHPPIITCWVEMNPMLFSSVREDSDLWPLVPQRFQRQIELALSDIDETLVKNKAQSVLSHLPNAPLSEVSTLLHMIDRRSLPVTVIDSWLSELLEKGTSEIRAAVVHALYFIFRKTQDLLLTLRLLCLAISKEPVLSKKMVNSLGFIIHHLRKPFEALGGQSVQELRTELAQKAKHIPDLDWEAERILDFSLDDISSFIDLIESRLRLATEVRERGTIEDDYQAVSYTGIHSIKKRIKSFDDYEKLVQKVVGWGDQDAFARDFDLEHLMCPLASLRDAGSGRFYLHTYIEKQLEEHCPRSALVASSFLPLTSETITLFVGVGEAAIAEGIVKETERLFYKKTDPEGGWLSVPGKPPSSFMERKTLFEKMREAAKPGKFRSLLSECLKIIDKRIEDHIKCDEEFLNPR